MVAETGADSDDDWRLTAELEVGDERGELHKLISQLREGGSEGGIAGEVQAVPHDVVITHDGRLLFAYAAKETVLTAARRAIESVLAREQIVAHLRISRWDEELDRWLQVDPPLSADQADIEAAREREEETMETRTMVAVSGRLVRGEFEQTMRAWAGRLGLECEIVEHPHLLRTQVAFTVTGRKRKVDEFAQGLEAEGWMYVRTENQLMGSSL